MDTSPSIVKALNLENNKLLVDRHIREGKKQRVLDSNSSDGPWIKKLQNQAAKQQLPKQLARLADGEAARVERK